MRGTPLLNMSNPERPIRPRGLLRGLTSKERWLLLAAAIYLLSPVDLIPELLTGPLGLVDDSAALLLAAGLLGKAASRNRTVTI